MAEQNIQKLLDAQTKAIDAKFEKQTKEIERHQKMLLEEFQSRLKVIGEVVVSHSSKLDAIMEMTALNAENIELIKGSLKRKVDIEEHELLIKRIAIVEKKLRVAGI